MATGKTHCRIIVAVGFLSLVGACWFAKPPGEARALLAQEKPRAGAAQPKVDDRVFHTVARGDLVLTIVERGELESAKNADIFCKVRSLKPNQPASKIMHLVDNGTHVKEGQIVVKLDDSALKEDRQTQAIVVAEKRALLVEAEKDLEIAENRAKSDVQSAEKALKIAEVELKNYLDGEAGQKRKFAIKVQQAKLAVTAKQGGDKKTEAEIKIAEGLVEIAEIDLSQHVAEAALQKLRLEQQAEQTKQALALAKLQAAARQFQARAKLEAAKATLEAEEAKAKDLDEDLAHCTIKAPIDGLVIYHIPEQSRFGSQQSTIAEGETVRENQRLMRIPDLRAMEVRIKIHEALRSRLRKDQRAEIRVAAFERPLAGRVKWVSVAASAADWSSSDVRVYPALVAVDDCEEIRKQALVPGMSAEVTIVLDERKRVLLIPVEAVAWDGDDKVCYVKAGNDVGKRKIVTGFSDRRVVEIREGLKEGESVLLNPKPATRPRQSRLDSEGSNNIVVLSIKPPDDGAGRRAFVQKYGLTHDDFERFQEMLPRPTAALPMRMFPAEARPVVGSTLVNARVVATTGAYADFYKIETAQGRFLTEHDEKTLANVAVLGAEAARALFPAENPLGKSITLGGKGQAFTVIGVLNKRSPVGEGDDAETFNTDVYVPLASSRKLLGELVYLRTAGSRSAEAVQLHRVVLTFAEREDMRRAIDGIVRHLKQSHDKPDWALASSSGGILKPRAGEVSPEPATPTPLLRVEPATKEPPPPPGKPGEGGFRLTADQQKEFEGFKDKLRNAKTAAERKDIFEKRLREMETRSADFVPDQTNRQEVLKRFRERLKEQLAKDGIIIPD